MDDFYIVLPSNTPVSGNKTSKFIVRLPETLELDTSWSVALSSIIYPYSFTALGIEGREFINVFEKGKTEGLKIYLPDMNFKTARGLEKKINEAFSHYYDLRKVRRKREAKSKEEGTDKQIDSAKRASNRAWRETQGYVQKANNIITQTRRLMAQSKELSSNSLEAPGVKELFEKLAEKSTKFESLFEEINTLSKEVEGAQNSTLECVAKQDLKGAKKFAEKAKVAARNVKTKQLEIVREHANTTEEGFAGLVTRVNKIIGDFLQPQTAEDQNKEAPQQHEIDPIESQREESDVITGTQKEETNPTTDEEIEEPKEVQEGENFSAELIPEPKISIAEDFGKPPPRPIEFRYDTVDQKFIVHLDAAIPHIELSEHLAYVLGFKKLQLHHGDEAPYMPDLTGGVRQIYIYAPNLVENTIIGNRLAPLLRIINVVGDPGSINEVIYSTEYFHRLQSKRIAEISVEIYTPFGELVKFHWGTCILTLHFKKSLF
ncbi:hypothetical protein GPALN_016300 [Globodera pallida]|nr:hypothetical protein GPALN_016300 [Globodera pallida]